MTLSSEIRSDSLLQKGSCRVIRILFKYYTFLVATFLLRPVEFPPFFELFLRVGLAIKYQPRLPLSKYVHVYLLHTRNVLYR